MTANLTDSDPAIVHETSEVRVLKFGGTSVGSGDRIRDAAELVLGEPGNPVVVVSAMSGVTDHLVRFLGRGSETVEELQRTLEDHHMAAAMELLPEGDARAALIKALRHRIARLAEHRMRDPHTVSGAGKDQAEGRSPDPAHAVMATGEDLSVLLMAAALNHLAQDRGPSGSGAGGHPPSRHDGRAPDRAQVVDARSLVRTEDLHGHAIPRDEDTVALARRHLLPLVKRGVIPVIQGFVGATADGHTTTLGRGGSDFTAAIVGAALGSAEVTIWTDVDGIFSADPHRIPGARVLPELGYEEAVELAYFGARVIHPAAAKHAVGRQVALRIRNTFNPSHPGTLIRTDRRGAPGVAALAFKPRVALLRVRSRPFFMAYGFLARVFEVLTRNRVPVDLVSTSHTSTAFTVDHDEPLDEVRRELDAFAEVELQTGLGTVSAIGAGLLRVPGITGEIFRVLGDTPVHMISQATDTSLSFVVDEDRGLEVVERLHRTLLDSEDALTRRAP